MLKTEKEGGVVFSVGGVNSGCSKKGAGALWYKGFSGLCHLVGENMYGLKEAICHVGQII